MAIGTVVVGALLTALGHAAPAPEIQFTFRTSVIALLPAIAFGLLGGFALGVDFPNANRRFARLV